MINKEKFSIGDHLASKRLLYTHHGLYMGKDFVIEYDRESGVQIVALHDFEGDSPVSGAFVVEHKKRLYSRRECIQRALSRLGENDYNLAVNNCEHFVNWCIEGKAVSYQVQDVYSRIGDIALSYFLSRSKSSSVLKFLPASEVLAKTIGSYIDSSLAAGAVSKKTGESFEQSMKSIFVKSAQKEDDGSCRSFSKKAADTLKQSGDFVKSIDMEKVHSGAKKTYDTIKESVQSGMFDSQVARMTQKQVAKITDNETILKVSAGGATLVSMGAGAVAGTALAATFGGTAAAAIGVVMAAGASGGAADLAHRGIKKIIKKKKNDGSPEPV